METRGKLICAVHSADRIYNDFVSILKSYDESKGNSAAVLYSRIMDFLVKNKSYLFKDVEEVEITGLPVFKHEGLTITSSGDASLMVYLTR